MYEEYGRYDRLLFNVRPSGAKSGNAGWISKYCM
jgi:hypothetical protein